MAPVNTHPGGPFYVWYQSVYGYPPPAAIDSNATRYLAWQQGVPKDQAAMIPQGTQGQPSAYFAGVQAAEAQALALAAQQAQAAAAAASAQLQAQEQAAAAEAAAAAAAAAANSPPAAAAPAPAPAGITKGINPGQPGNTIVTTTQPTPATPPPVTGPGGITKGINPGQPGNTIIAVPPPAPGSDTGPTASAAGGGPIPTYYGVTLDHNQIIIVGNVLNIGLGYTHDPIVLGAAYYAMMGESDINFPANLGGPFQTTCSVGSYNNGQDYEAQAHSFFNGGLCFTRGAVSYRREYDTEWQIANATEENAVWSQSRGDSYARDGYSTAALTAEAKYAVAYFLPGLGQGGSTTPITTPTPVLSPNPTPPGTDLAPVAWGNTHNSGAVDNGYYQLHRTYQVWNPQFRDQLNTLANRPITG